jgi:hypothetical protein
MTPSVLSISSFGYFPEITTATVMSFGYFDNIATYTGSRYYNVLREMYGKFDRKFYDPSSNYHKWQVNRGKVFDAVDAKISQLLPETLPDECTDEGLLLQWEQLLGTDRYKVKPNSLLSLEKRRALVVSMLTLQQSQTRENVETVFVNNDYTISTQPSEDAPMTVRIVEGQQYYGFRADYGRADIDTVWDTTNVQNGHIITIKSLQNEDVSIMKLLNDFRYIGTLFVWEKL